MKALKKLEGRQSGIALLTTILLLLLMSSLLVGFMLMVTSGQRLSGMNNDYSRAFYASEAGMEKMTADLGTLFDSTYSPTAAQLSVITSAPPSLPGIQFLSPDGTSGYTLTYPVDANGNPAATNIQIKSGPYQGMIALATPYTLTVTAHTANGAEVKLQRTSQTVGIPMFQFGIFSDPDLSFHAGPPFSFGGRVHTNGNLWLAEGGGNTLTMSDRVTAVKQVIRTNLANGQSITSGWSGTVNITTAPGTASFRSLASTEGSVTGGTPTSPANLNWPTISTGAPPAGYAGNLRNGTTGARPLNLASVTLGQGTPTDLIRRPLKNELANNPDVLGERFFAQASLKILLSDDPQDIMELPCIDSTVLPFNLADIALPVISWASANATALQTAMNAAGTLPVPMAASGASSALPAGPYSSTDGYWLPKNAPVITGHIKIEAQTAYGSPCGSWRDVTQEILSLGYAGRNLSPVTSPAAPSVPTTLPPSQAPSSTCQDPHPNAVIRLERVRDNPGPTGGCGVTVTGGVVTAAPQNSYDYWPNVLFDPREGRQRDNVPPAPNGTAVTLMGLMHYVELDVKNLGRWFNGNIGATGPSTRDPNIAPNNFVVYISDRRGNYVPGPLPNAWPPLSPSGHETGEFGFQDFLNTSRGSANACPDSILDGAEDVSQTGGQSGNPATYGQTPTPSVLNALFNTATPGDQIVGTGKSVIPDPQCAGALASNLWPGWFVSSATIAKRNEARQNPSLYFRRAVKLVNSNLINLGSCPGAVPCGLTIATENPVYVQGDFNANSSNGGFNDPHVAVSIVTDAIAMLSKDWNDVNSFAFPWSIGTAASPKRKATTTWYRTAIVSGKGIAFPWISGTTADTGSDGGVHNFLRFLEYWGGQTVNYRGSIISMYFNRQGTGIFRCCAGVTYSPPTRGYNFDVEFLEPTKLPPRTPMFRDVNTTGFTQLILPKQ